ncbi:MAG: hypothetical protein LBD18_06760 [Treponema sp.]|jgi:hypothetical protein|nr:hypothetical protein [Treponema sp.]
MRRIIVFLCVFALFAVSLYAEIGFSGWGRGVVTPLAFEGEYSGVSAATNSWSETPRVGFSVIGKSESGFIGFNLGAFWDGGDLRADIAKAWVRPVKMFTLTAGSFEEDDFRGKIGASEFNSWILPNGSKDEDNIFTRFKATLGAHFKLEPLAWLNSEWAQVIIEGAFGSTPGGQRIFKHLINDSDPDNPNNLADVYKAIQIGIAYTIPNTGFVRIQYIGNNRSEIRKDDHNRDVAFIPMEGLSNSSDADVIEAAFQYTGLEGLNVDAGVKIPFEFDTNTEFLIYDAVKGNRSFEPYYNPIKADKTVQRSYTVALGVNWKPVFLDALNILARADFSTGGWVEAPDNALRVEYGSDFRLYIVPSYRISTTIRAGVDFGLQIHDGDKWLENKKQKIERTENSKFTDIGFGPWGELSMSGGTLKIGVMVMMPGTERYRFNVGNSDRPFSIIYSGDPVITVPIFFTYSL